MTAIPKGLDARGRKLWRSLAEQDPDMSGPAQEVALEACRVADRLERLNAICDQVEPVIETEKGGVITHPAFAEARQQANLLKQLVAALRLPDEATGRRPQQRGPRGAYQPRTGGNVSSLEKARQRAAGA